MSVRIRLIYSKRGAACFVPHIALAQIFARSASRAGFSLELSQGFSPRPKLSFGPELPAGVVALHEPVDIYFAEEPVDVVDSLNLALPEGFRIFDAVFISEGSPNLGKFCTHAEYFIRIAECVSGNSIDLAQYAQEFYGNAAIEIKYVDGWLRLVTKSPAQFPIGGLVKYLISSNIISGWHEINIVRNAVGIYHPQKGSVILNA